MKTKITIVSLLLNLALAAGLVWMITVRRPAEPLPTAPLLAAPPPAVSPAMTPTAPAPVIVNPARTNFHWSQIESADYLDFIANLRAIGCPEETIRDIIVADVNKLFAPRYAALTGTAPELAWWGRYDKRKPLRAELAARLRELHEEKKALLTRLLGPGAGVEQALVEGSVAAVRENNTYAFLPDSKQAAVRNLIRHYETLQEWSEPQWRGLPTDERQAREKELREARDRELAALLTPEELREFEVRHSPTAEALREQYGRADLTEAEFREMYERRREFERQNPESKIEDWKRLEAEYAATLGADRYTDLQRQNDATWRALQNLAVETGLSPDAMNQAYAIKQDYAERLVASLGPFFEDPTRDPAPLRAIAAEMDEQLAAVLGPEAVQRLDRLGALPRLVVEDDGKRKSYSFSRSGASN